MADHPRRPQPWWKSHSVKLGLALGGMGGLNAHGAGVLAGLADSGMVPDLISCSSGQIHWVVSFLKGENLRERVVKLERKLTPFPEPFRALNFWRNMMFGVPGVGQAMSLSRQMLGGGRLMEMMQRFGRTGSLVDAALPMPNWSPARPDAFFEDAAEVINKSTIGIFFNSFNPKTGIEHVHVNKIARAQVDLRRKQRKNYPIVWRQLDDVTPAAVRDALWLVQFGMGGTDGAMRERIDGAYVRQLLLRELTHARTIIAVPPVDAAWRSATPSNMMDLQAWQLRMWFGQSLREQMEQIHTMNDMIKRNIINDNSYHMIKVIQVDPPKIEKYYDYMLERASIFDAARQSIISRLVDSNEISPWRAA